METTVFTCKNCGFPLNVPNGAESVRCPQCRGTNALPSKVDANAKIQLILLELQTAKDEYRKVFLPKKENAEEMIKSESVNYAHLYHKVNTGSGVSWARISGWVVLIIGGIYFVVSFAKQPIKDNLFTFIIWLFWLWSLLFAPAAKKRRIKSELADKEREWRQTWEKWTREEEEHRAKIAALEGELRKFRGA